MINLRQNTALFHSSQMRILESRSTSAKTGCSRKDPPSKSRNMLITSKEEASFWNLKRTYRDLKPWNGGPSQWKKASSSSKNIICNSKTSMIVFLKIWHKKLHSWFLQTRQDVSLFISILICYNKLTITNGSNMNKKSVKSQEMTLCKCHLSREKPPLTVSVSRKCLILPLRWIKKSRSNFLTKMIWLAVFQLLPIDTKSSLIMWLPVLKIWKHNWKKWKKDYHRLSWIILSGYTIKLIKTKCMVKNFTFTCLDYSQQRK